MKNFIKFLKYWGQLLLLPIYWFSFFTPRDKNIWLFGSTFGRRFADNPRYLYIFCSQHKEKKIHPIWISHKKEIIYFLNKNGYEAYYYLSLKGIWYCLIGKVYIFDNYTKDINFWLSGGATKINLWHGVGNKRINNDNKFDRVRHPKNIWEKFKFFPRKISDEKPSHYILSTSPVMNKIFSRAFQVSKKHIIEAGYPRNDIFFKQCEMDILYMPIEREIIDVINGEKRKGKKIIGYMPTFRESEKNFKKIINLPVLNTFYRENGFFMICKLHPKSYAVREFEKVKFSNIYNVEPNIDSNLLLKQIDILVTDYSSVYSDYLLLERPVIAFWYDYDEYITQTRGTYFKFKKYMPELVATDMKTLMKMLLVVKNFDLCKDKRNIIKNILFKNCEYGACEDIINKILTLEA